MIYLSSVFTPKEFPTRNQNLQHMPYTIDAFIWKCHGYARPSDMSFNKTFIRLAMWTTKKIILIFFFYDQFFFKPQCVNFYVDITHIRNMMYFLLLLRIIVSIFTSHLYVYDVNICFADFCKQLFLLHRA